MKDVSEGVRRCRSERMDAVYAFLPAGDKACPHLVETKPCNLARCCKFTIDEVASTGVHTMCGAGQEHDVYVQIDGGVAERLARPLLWRAPYTIA